MVVIPVSAAVKPENISQIKRVVSNRINSHDLEQYLIEWAGKWPTDRSPLSWHSIDELRSCLHLVQEYLDAKPQVLPPIKRKSPHDEDETTRHSTPDSNSHRSSSLLSTSTAASTPSSSGLKSRDINVYNGVLRIKDGYYAITSSSDPNVPQIKTSDVPTRAMISKALSSTTSTAELRIRCEVNDRLRAIPDPKVSMLNTRDTSSLPLQFRFIDNCVLREGVHKADTETLMGCQQCRPNMGQNIGCEYTKRCDCLEYAAVDEARLDDKGKAKYLAVKVIGGDTSGFPKKFPYSMPGGKSAGCLVNFYLDRRHTIYECNDNCKCGPQCKNRNVQWGRQVPLQIFKTEDRGWGLRCPQPLIRGQFIDTYRGEIITPEEADRRENQEGKKKDSYLYTLDKFASKDSGLNPDEMYVIDGEYMGGPTRFINHSCDPNCRQYAVSYNKNDPMVYEIAFFACRDIPAWDELTFDYLDKDDEDESEDGPDTATGAEADEEVEGKIRIPCNCGAENCRKWLWE